MPDETAELAAKVKDLEENGEALRQENAALAKALAEARSVADLSTKEMRKAMARAESAKALEQFMEMVRAHDAAD